MGDGGERVRIDVRGWGLSPDEKDLAFQILGAQHERRERRPQVSAACLRLALQLVSRYDKRTPSLAELRQDFPKISRATVYRWRATIAAVWGGT